MNNPNPLLPLLAGVLLVAGGAVALIVLVNSASAPWPVPLAVLAAVTLASLMPGDRHR